jgi:cysteine-rich repeat protein
VATFWDSQEKKCLPCSDGCLSCTSCYSCTQCTPKYTFNAALQRCTENCGDGFRFTLACDDGNNINGDGCTSDCKIEPGYHCVGGSPNSRDTCSKYLPSQLAITSTGQSHIRNKIILNVRVNYLPPALISTCVQATDNNVNCEKVL